MGAAAPGRVFPVLLPNHWSLGLILGGLALLAVQILWTLVAHRARWSRAPILLFGIGLAASLQLLAFGRTAVSFAGSLFDLPTLGSGLPYLTPLVVPVSLAIALDGMQRRAARPVATSVIAVPLFILAIRPWISVGPVSSDVAATGSVLAAAFILLYAGTRWVSSSGRLRPDAMGGALIVAAIIPFEFTEAFFAVLTVDVHLRDTYFPVGSLHLGALAMLLALAASLWQHAHAIFGPQRHIPPSLVRVGMTVLALGFGVSAFAMLALGHAGMPRRYFAYLEQFTAGFRIVGIFGGVGVLGMLILAVAFTRRNKVSSSALGPTRE